MSQRTAERPACFSHPFYEVSHSLLWRARVTMNSWNHCGNKCYIMYLSIKHVWMYFVKTNCNDMKGGRLLVYIDYFVAQSKQKNEAEKSLRMKSFCMHQYAFAFPRQPATAYTWRKYVLHRKSVWWVNWFYYSVISQRDTIVSSTV